MEHKKHSGNDYNYGCVLTYLELADEYWEKFINSIDVDDLYHCEEERYGVETEPHITLLYGIHEDVLDNETIELCKTIIGSDILIDCTHIECFQNKEFDVVKLSVSSDTIHSFNERLRTLPHTNNYTYKPHVTIAYVKPGMGPKYCKAIEPLIIKGISNVTYSKTSGEKIIISI
jgi:2'-5' RNA ligase